MPKRQKKKLKGHEWRHIENKKLIYTVYFILRVSVVLMLVAQFFNQNYENVLLCVLTLVLFMLPSAFERRLHIDLPDTLEVIILLFIYAAEILGEIQSYYTSYPGWDTMLHTMNGFLCAAIGFALVDILNREEKVSLHLSPFFMAVTAFCFSMTIGVLWEFFEFAMDRWMLFDMQKDTVINTISTVNLDPNHGTTAVIVQGIQDVILVLDNGTQMPLGLGGYLDVGIIDTMKDIILKSYGVKSPDGRRFIKNQEVRDAFAQTEAYSQLFMELATNAKAASDFVAGIIPAKEDVASDAETPALPGGSDAPSPA